MPSHPELTALAAGKATFSRRITPAAARVAQPVVWPDQAFARWRQLSPLVRFAALPVEFLLKRSLAPRLRVRGAVRSLPGACHRSPRG